MAVCGIGQERWSNIIGHSKKSATVKVHGNSNNSNATINSDSPVIRNLAEHFEKLESMAEVIATRTVREITGEVLLRDTSDTKKYLPPWMTNDKAGLSQRLCFEVWLRSDIQQPQSGNLKMGWQWT